MFLLDDFASYSKQFQTISTGALLLFCVSKLCDFDDCAIALTSIRFKVLSFLEFNDILVYTSLTCKLSGNVGVFF